MAESQVIELGQIFAEFVIKGKTLLFDKFCFRGDCDLQQLILYPSNSSGRFLLDPSHYDIQMSMKYIQKDLRRGNLL